MQFKQGIGWKACYDEEQGVYTAKTSCRGDFHLYEIDADTFNSIGEPGISDEDSESLIRKGRHLYYCEDNPIGPPTDIVLDENYASLCSWTEIPSSGHTLGKELTGIGVELFENEKTKEHWSHNNDKE